MKVTSPARSPWLIAVLIAAVSTVVFAAFMGAIPLFDWDEVNFAEIAREMILTGDYGRVYIDFVPFWEKPPLFFWLQALSMHIWGITDFAARFPNAVCGGVTLSALYLIGRKWYDHRFGLLWVFAFAGSILPHLYFRSGIIDPWFNLWIFLSVMSVLRFIEHEKKTRDVAIGGFFMGLAVLTKGPVAWLVIALVAGIYWIIRRSRSGFAFRHLALYSLIALLTFGIWYGFETARNGPWFLEQFVTYQFDLLIRPGAGHAGFPGYHVVVLLFGCFPASVYALQPLFRKTNSNAQYPEMRLWMLLLLFVVIGLFSLVQSKIVHYSSLCYFPITFFATLYIWRKMHNDTRPGLWQKFGITAIGTCYALAGIALVYLGMHPELIDTFASLDDNARASLAMPIDWEWWHVAPVLFILFAIAVLWRGRLRTYAQTIVVYLCFALFTYTGIACWVGKVQQYSQGPSTAFFTSLQGQEVYAVPWGHKTYSRYWDFRKPVPPLFDPRSQEGSEEHLKYSSAEFLLTTTLDREVHIITKVSKADAFEQQFPGVERTGQEGGFVFFVKRPAASSSPVQ